MPSTTIYLVRHAESEANASGVFSGHYDAPLTPKGRRQATALARRLAGTPIDRIVSSDLKRALETARLLSSERGIPVDTEARLREMHYGEWEGKTQEQISAQYGVDWEAVMRPSADFRIPGGESLAELRARVHAVYREVVAAHPEQTVVLLTHGNAKAALLGALLDLPYKNSWRFQIANTGLTQLRDIDGTPVIQSVNDTAHLDDGLR